MFEMQHIIIMLAWMRDAKFSSSFNNALILQTHCKYTADMQRRSSAIIYYPRTVINCILRSVCLINFCRVQLYYMCFV